MTAYLSKSRFKQALECPRKLFYSGKSDYADNSLEDEFLAALAEGGFQVGELAKLHFPDGITIRARDQGEQCRETSGYLQRKDVTLFEATVQVGNFVVRVDVLEKKGDEIRVIEVKAKSFDPQNSTGDWWTRSGITSDMLPYLQDIAFQAHVVRQAYPEFDIRSELILVDKSLQASIDGLNQCFKIHVSEIDGKRQVSCSALPGVSLASIGTSVLTRVPVDNFVDHILNENLLIPGMTGSFSAIAEALGKQNAADDDIEPAIGAHCGKCQFRNSDYPAGLKSGFHECWKRALQWDDAHLEKPLVLDLFNSRRKQQFIDNKKYLLEQIRYEDLDVKEEDGGLSVGQRQWFQCSNTWPGDGAFYLDRDAVAAEMASWSYPLHFIDFEGCRPALPFKAGKPGYGIVAFQFSHHVLEADGTVRHANQFLDATLGRDPNLAFLYALAKALQGPGTVLMWSPYENSVLNELCAQLEQNRAEHALGEHDQLLTSILALTVDNKTGRRGMRAMVDLAKLAAHYFFHPHTQGRSSIKVVLPAVLQSSDYLRQRYSLPCYGQSHQIHSKNFPEMVWWQPDPLTGLPRDPYKMLPPIFDDIDAAAFAGYGHQEDEGIREGGAAATAYARLQFSDVDPQLREAVRNALLRYCELDTLAMVMVVEAWREWCRS